MTGGYDAVVVCMRSASDKLCVLLSATIEVAEFSVVGVTLGG